MSHALPVNENPYIKFIDFLLKNNCTMPKDVKLPFPKSSDPSPFGYLSTPLSECQTLDAFSDNSESKLLCKEVFDVLQNITCSENIEPIPKIESRTLSTDVCGDFKIMKNVFPKRDDYLSGKLTDETICKVLCTSNKYELLCKTLLWSYDTLTKIQNAVEIEGQDSDKEKTNQQTQVLSAKVPSSIKVSLGMKEPKSNNQNDVLSNLNANDKNSENEKIPDKSHLNYSSVTVPDTKVPDGLVGTAVSSSTKFSASTQKSSDKAVNNSATTSKFTLTTVQKNVSETNSQELPQKVTNQATSPVDAVNLSNENSIDDHLNHKENEISNEPVKKVKVVDNNSQENDNINVSNDNTGETTNDQKVKNLSEETLQNKEKDKDNTNTENDKKTSIKSEESETPHTEISNELNNASPQENESKNKNTDFKTQNEKELEKPKLTNFENPNEVLPGVDSKLPESSTLQILPEDDAEEHQEDKEQDQYNDTENEGDYQKADYENFNPPTKNREANIKSSISGSSQLSNNYDSFISPRNNGRAPEEVPMIPFPEQEDSHFFFYFLTVVLIFMAGYLIFHNKQKIIALIVEGRHERRRRSHGAGYKKLETK